MPGGHKRVKCDAPNCDWEGRSDKFKRHKEWNHLRHATKERKVYVPGPLEKRIKACKEKVEAFKNGLEYDPNKVGTFGDFEYLFGNLTHANTRKMLVRAHYNWMTCEWAERIDGLTSSDEGWKNWMIQNIDRFSNEQTRWIHFLTSDKDLYKNLFRGHAEFKPVPAFCACLCNEVSKQPLSKAEVEMLIQQEQWHFHFIVEAPARRVPHCIEWVKSFLSNNVRDPFCKPAKNGHATTVLDKMRVFHYVHRRESSIGLPMHFHIEGPPRWRFAPDNWRSLMDRVRKERPDAFAIHLRLLALAQSECNNCRKAARGFCKMHIRHDLTTGAPLPDEGFEMDGGEDDMEYHEIVF